MLMPLENTKYTNLGNRIILNRTTRNPELFLNPMEPNNMFDPNLDQRWKMVENCFYCSGYRYTLVYFNAFDVSKNSFKVLGGQDDMMNFLDSKFPLDAKSSNIKPPLLIVDGNVYPMVNPLIYTCFLQLQSLAGEIRSSAQRGGHELTGVSAHAPALPP
jgi:hypothetical protein